MPHANLPPKPVNRLRTSWLPLLFVAAAAVAAVDFETEIKPILSKRCLECHGPEKQKSSFRVDGRQALLAGGDTGKPAVVPGDSAKSHLMLVLRTNEPDISMPPKGDRLSAAQLSLLERWIAEGAVWPGQMAAVATKPGSDHWSLQPVVRPAIPAIPARGAVDAFLLAELTKQGLTYSKPAAPRALLRRASVTLTGLLPTAERADRFVADHARDADAAYRALVEELLASPHFGERWAQHWLDVIRWAETNGSEANLYRKNSWIYRDYVVRAFNTDLPYDRFIREQLAGDQLGAGDATGFLVAGPHVPAATVGQEPTAIRQARADRLDEVMQTLGASVLGLTVSCARCHNHKFDPISTKDYYSLTAVFQGVEFGGRRPELAPEHPRQQRAEELHRQMQARRAQLRDRLGVWSEDWGGYSEFHFPARQTQALRVEFASNYVSVDELEVFGPAEQGRNLALAAAGTSLVGDQAMVQLRGEIAKANDGKFGTEGWKARAEKGAKTGPWVEIRFPRPQQVDRFRLSSNREYYFETDYLAGEGGAQLPPFKLLTLRPDGTWQEIGDTAALGRKVTADPLLRQADEALRGLIANLNEEGPRHSFVGRFIQPVDTRVLLRGSPETPGDAVPPAGFAVLGGDLGLDSSAPESVRRLRFAAWLTRPEHPLTARVMVNRLWHHVFGAGLVVTAADFGKAGMTPSHPALLDFLASEFTAPSRSGAQPWGVTDLLRTLVLSDAFRQDSAPSAEGLRRDAGSALLWRFPPRRVEAEVIRDSVLLASGKLDRSVGGRGFRIHDVKKTYAQWQVTDNHGPQTWRRMLYQERMRRVDDKIFTAFDFPDCGQVSAKRAISTTPLQALNLMNSDFIVEQARFVAEQAAKGAAPTDHAVQVRNGFRLLLGRDPSAAELAASVEVARESGLPVVCRALINSNEFGFLP